MSSKRGSIQVIDREKFMLRIPDSLHSMLSEIAEQNDRSINGEIAHALFQWTQPKSRIKVLYSHMQERFVRSGLPFIFPQVERANGSGAVGKKMCCRFSLHQHSETKKEAATLNISMNWHVLQIIVWWVNINIDIDILSAALDQEIK